MANNELDCSKERFIRTIMQDPEFPEELLLDLGNEICETLGWKAGDDLVWTDNKDGSWTLSKKITR